MGTNRSVLGLISTKSLEKLQQGKKTLESLTRAFAYALAPHASAFFFGRADNVIVRLNKLNACQHTGDIARVFLFLQN